jgi:hypothetical protein
MTDKPPKAESLASRKRDLAALLATERWVRVTRKKLHHDIYGPFSLFSTLPLELLHAILDLVLADDLRHPDRPCASVALLSTCRDARDLLHGWSVHAYHLMGGIPLTPATSLPATWLRFYLRALNRVRRGRAMEAGCNPAASRFPIHAMPPCETPDIGLLARANHHDAIQWLLTSTADLEPLVNQAFRGKHVETVLHNLTLAARRDIRKFADCADDYVLNPDVGLLFQQATQRAFAHQREPWIRAVVICVQTLNPRFMSVLLPLYQDGWMTRWELPLDMRYHSNGVCTAAHTAFPLLCVPASASDPVNPLVKTDPLVAVTSPRYKELTLTGVVCTARGLHQCRKCSAIGIVERIRRAHKRGAVIPLTDGLLACFSGIDGLVEAAAAIQWGAPTLEQLRWISGMRGKRCAGMERIAILSGGRGEWAAFMAELPDNALRRRLKGVISPIQ